MFCFVVMGYLIGATSLTSQNLFTCWGVIAFFFPFTNVILKNVNKIFFFFFSEEVCFVQ